jgi:transposase
MKKRYEISDSQWELIKDLLPPERKKQGGKPAKDNRTILNAMLWIVRSGAPWRDLPTEYYHSWKTVYTRFSRWKQAGIFEQILAKLTVDADQESIMLDSTTIRVHQHGAGAKGGKNFRL